MKPKNLFMILALPIAAQLVTGCSYIKVAEDPYFDEEAYASRLPLSLAIAPFQNETDIEGMGEDMRRAVYNALASLPYDDVELDKVDSIIAGKATLLDLPPEQVDPFYIAEPDLADAVLFARVERVSRLSLIFYASIRVDLRLLLVDTTTRRYLYRNHISVRNRLIAIPTSPFGILNSIFSSIWHIRREEMETSIKATASEVAERFPQRTSRVVAGGTWIDQVTVQVPRTTMRVGDRVLVRAEGAPGRKATLTIGPILAEEAMVEIAPGEYTGAYEVKNGDHGRFLFAVVRFENESDADEWTHVDATDQPFAIDTIPPPPYEVGTWAKIPDRPGIKLTFSPENRAEPNADDLPVAFHVYRGLGLGKPLDYLGTATRPQYEDGGAEAGVEYEYAVVAEDAAGNRSEPKSRVLVRL